MPHVGAVFYATRLCHTLVLYLVVAERTFSQPPISNLQSNPALSGAHAVHTLPRSNTLHARYDVCCFTSRFHYCKFTMLACFTFFLSDLQFSFLFFMLILYFGVCTANVLHSHSICLVLTSNQYVALIANLPYVFVVLRQISTPRSVPSTTSSRRCTSTACPCSSRRNTPQATPPPLSTPGRAWVAP